MTIDVVAFLSLVVQPDGKPVIRALDVFMLAVKHGKEFDFVAAFGKPPSLCYAFLIIPAYLVGTH